MKKYSLLFFLHPDMKSEKIHRWQITCFIYLRIRQHTRKGFWTSYILNLRYLRNMNTGIIISGNSENGISLYSLSLLFFGRNRYFLNGMADSFAEYCNRLIFSLPRIWFRCFGLGLSVSDKLEWWGIDG